jgi:hypothetical protein
MDSIEMDSIAKDRDFMDRGLEWPKYPILPVKLRNGDTHNKYFCGFVFGYVDPKPIVYFGNIYDLNNIADKIQKETGNKEVTWGQILDTMESKTYSSLDSLVKEYRID